MTELFSPAELTDIVDTLADIRAQISELKDREEIYKAALIASGHAAVDGTEHRATVSETLRTVTDWRAVAERLSPSPQLIRAHTTTADQPTYTVRLFGRKTTA